MHLAGHQHIPTAEAICERGLPGRHLWVNSSLYGTGNFEGKKERIHGYSAIQLLTDGTKWYYRAWPRRANKRQEWRLRFDTDFEVDEFFATPVVEIKAPANP